MIDYSLSDLEERLDAEDYSRGFDRATVVNTAFIEELDAWVDGG